MRKEFRCPYCNKLVGITKEDGKSIVKVLRRAPKNKSNNETIFENKCPKCNNLVYLQFRFLQNTGT